MARQGRTALLLAIALLMYLVLPNQLATSPGRAHSATTSQAASPASAIAEIEVAGGAPERPVASFDDVTMPPRGLVHEHPPADRDVPWVTSAALPGLSRTAPSGRLVCASARAVARPTLTLLQVLRC
ncbi:hypothetical protein ACFOY4_30840 [Actinomadura syzygii]|uniref:Uncharacterized protein n=1 Tax=Actinomadura syzygii TaxID=1427538 RepID=A0A5D0TV34_9ACTN|nr:hypothetical protein [Actinomadura syzygii]TYC08719.1 hypothetical protein FXF65_38245 [Actinomadura syzygii]